MVWECFRPSMAAQLHKTHLPFGIIATEIPDGAGFNGRREPDWRARYTSFGDVARRASFIWTMVESTVPYYAQFCPTAFVELGYSDRLIPSDSNVEPDVDFSFFGLSTPYRIEAVERLRRHAKVVWPTGFLSAPDVRRLISRTRVGLNFKQSANWPVPSPTRLGRFLMARRDLASERTEVPTRQGEIIGMPPANEDFVEFALDRLRSDWRVRAERALASYRESMPMRTIMESVLDRTIGGIADQGDARGWVPIAQVNTSAPELLLDRGAWNIVGWDGAYYALRKSSGPMDVREGVEVLQARLGKEAIRQATMVERLLARVVGTT